MPKSNTNKDLKVKINIQSTIPTSSLYCEKMYGWMKLCIFTIRSLFVLLFGMPSLHHFSFVMIFLSCIIESSNTLDF